MKAHVSPTFLTPLPPPGQNPGSLAWVHPPPLSCELQRGCPISQLIRPITICGFGWQIFYSAILPPWKEHLWGKNRWQSRKMETICSHNEQWLAIDYLETYHLWIYSMNGNIFLYFLTAQGLSLSWLAAESILSDTWVLLTGQPYGLAAERGRSVL